MKQNRIKLILAAFCVALTLAGLAKPALADESDANAIVGTWLATVTNLNPPPAPGAPTSFLSLATFTGSGEAFEEANGTSIRSVAQGEWVRVGHRQFVRTMFILTFTTGRVFTGMTRATTAIEVDKNGDEYDATATFETYDANGNLRVQGSNTSHAHRCSMSTTVPQCMGLVP